MNGVTARALESFVNRTYGAAAWEAVVEAAQDVPRQFELMLDYPPEVTGRVLTATAAYLQRDPAEVLEDLGHFLVSHPDMQATRRLLRFGGPDFAAFLHSTADMPERARLVLPHAILPPIRPIEEGGGRWAILCGRRPKGMVHVLCGAIRAMADDYGALATVDLAPEEGEDHRIEIHVLSDDFAEGRGFDLVALP